MCVGFRSSWLVHFSPQRCVVVLDRSSGTPCGCPRFRIRSLNHWRANMARARKSRPQSFRFFSNCSRFARKRWVPVVRMQQVYPTKCMNSMVSVPTKSSTCCLLLLITTKRCNFVRESTSQNHFMNTLFEIKVRQQGRAGRGFTRSFQLPTASRGSYFGFVCFIIYHF